MGYKIYCRYEIWTKLGKDYCNWFPLSNIYNSKEEAKKEIKNITSKFNYIDKATGLKHIYEIKETEKGEE